MLTLLFLGTSTSDHVLEEISPPKAAGLGPRLHTDILVWRSALLWVPRGMKPDSKTSAVPSDKQYVSQSRQL